jgi:ubiquinone biosynthesis protein
VLGKRSGVKWKTQRHFNRYTEIIRVLVKHGFGEFIDHSHLKTILGFRKKPLSRRDLSADTKHSKWVRIRMVLEELGLTFIKFGQIMSNRPDLLPDELINELEKLQSAVPPFPSADAVKILEEELGGPVGKVFLRFDEAPMASASIAQVHSAELLSGERVVVKIQRPNLEEIITTDIEIMHIFAALMESVILRTEVLNASAIIDEFGKSLRKEIDFTLEASNIKKFDLQFRSNSKVYIPKVFLEYTTKRVLVMERIDGIKVSNIRALLSAGNDPIKIAHNGAHVVIEQIFENGFFHADPHPGNLLVLDDNRICFLDFGMMGFLLPRHREILSSIMVALVEKDERRVTRGLLDLSLSKTPWNVESLEYEVFELIDRYTDRPLKAINLGELVTRLLHLVVAYRIQIPPGFFLLAKALVTTEGVALRLDPDFDMITHLEPIVRRMILKTFGPESLAREFYNTSFQTLSMLRSFPGDAKEILEKIKAGRVIFHFDPEDLKPILHKTDQIFSRLSFSVVLASLVIGSSIVITARIPPLWNNVSIIGIAGFLGAGLIGFWLLISMIRGNRMGDR